MLSGNKGFVKRRMFWKCVDVGFIGEVLVARMTVGESGVNEILKIW